MNRRFADVVSIRAALSGLTPQAAAVVAALLLARILSTMGASYAAAANNPALGIRYWFFRYAELLIMAAPMLIAILITANVAPRRGPKRIIALTAAVMLSTGAGLALRLTARDAFGIGLGWHFARHVFAYLWPRYVVLGGILTIVSEFHRREVTSVTAMQQAEIDRAAFEREMAEARLQVLQAQIEPHFLFNTLANVRRLYDPDRVAGRTMLDNLMRYLEVALPQMRERESTLGRDAELVEAFLHIHKIRMGQRHARQRASNGLDLCPWTPQG